jgi:subtilisin family serine protease
VFRTGRSHLGHRPLGVLVALIFALGMTAGVVPAAQPVVADEPAEVEPALVEQLATEGDATFWVHLHASADLSPAAAIGDWSEQGWFVYEELTSTAAESQAELLAMLEAEDVPHRSFWIANTVRVTGDAPLVERIAARPEVREITADRVYELPEPIPADDGPSIAAVEWGVERIGAPEVWDEFGARGEGIVIGTIDTGALHTHPALVEQYRGNNGDGTFDHNYSWHDPSEVCGSPSLEPCDNHGHGTHVAGTIVGDDGGENQIGVAPAARWIAAKGCESNNCSETALLSSGQFILAPTDLSNENPDPDRRPHIVNNSWGGAADDDPWYQPTVTAWVAAGIFPQFAAGNTTTGVAPCGSASNPGNLVESYAAGAFDSSEQLANFSNRGPSAWDDELIKPNIAAPGVAIRSAWNNGSYNTISGTSMASPHVAGAVALIWSAATSLERDIEATRQILDQTAIDTEDLLCGGTPENNNLWGEGRLDAFAAVLASPTGPTGTLQGTVTDAATGDPIAGADVTIVGAVERERTTAADGTYEAVLPVGDYDVTASAFGFEPATASVTIAEDQTTTADFALVAVEAISVSGTVTDGSGHGWPLYASVDAVGTPLSTWTDPFSGAYSISLPANATYTLMFDPAYPGYSPATHEVAAGEEDVVLDVALEVGIADCRDAPGYQLEQPEMAMVTSLPAQFQTYFDGRGIEVDFYTVSQLDQITGYDIVLWGYSATSVNEAAFLGFLDTTDAEGTGVVFLDHAFTTWNGIKTLSRFTGQPESVTTSTGGTGQENLYQVTQEHPILAGFEVGDVIIHEPGQTAWLAWFDGYAGEGRQVIADAGRTGDGILGHGIGVDERPNNRHALLSIHSQSATRGPSGWSEASDDIFWNAIQWAAPAGSGFACVPVEGGLVLGNVTDLNTGAGINGATVTSADAPDEMATTFATPDDPALDDGFYWMFSSLVGAHDFVAAAADYTDATETVDVLADSANRADFALAAGLLTVEPTELTAELRLGQSASRSFVVTNEGSAPAELQLIETGGSFEILGGAAGQDGPRLPSGDPPEAPAPSPGDELAREEAVADGGPALSVNPARERGASATPELPQPAQNEVTITHSASQTILAGNSVGCSRDSGLTTTENGYLRTFTLSDFEISGDFAVTSVAFGIEALDPAQTLTINLYTLEGDLIYDNLTLIGTADATIDAQDLSVVSVPVSGTAPAGSTLVVEIDAPDMSGSGRFFVGSNDAGQTAPSYLRSESCGIAEPTDTADLGFPDMHIVMSVTGEVGGDVPWLEVSPTAATLAPGESVTVTVGMDSGATDENQPGTYRAGVAIGHDTPYDVPTVGVTMSVTPPNNWGKVAGTVTGIECDGTVGPLEGATVQLDGRRESIALSTDADGGYARWMPTNNNPVRIIVAHAGYHPQTRQVQLVPRQTVVADFALSAICSSATDDLVN